MKQKLIIGLLIAGIALGAAMILSGLGGSKNQLSDQAESLQTKVATGDTYSISGQVKPAAGEPVVNADDTTSVPPWYFVKVRVVCHYMDASGKIKMHEDETDDEGKYTITGIPKGADCALSLVEKTAKYWDKGAQIHFFDNPRLIKDVKKDLSNNDFSLVFPVHRPATKGKIIGDLSGKFIKVGCTYTSQGKTYTRETVADRKTGEYQLFLPTYMSEQVDNCTLKAEGEGYTFEPESVDFKIEFGKLEFPDIKATKSADDDDDDKGISILGVVQYKGATNKPIRGVKVSAACHSDAESGNKKTYTYTSNEKGEYVLKGIPVNYTCVVNAKEDNDKITLDFINVPKTFENIKKDVTFNIEAEKAEANLVSLSGTARNENEKPISGVLIKVTDCKKSGDKERVFEGQDTTNAAGEYIINKIPKGVTCKIEVSKGDLKFKKNNFSLEFNNNKNFDPVAEGGTIPSDKTTCVDLGKSLAEDKNKLTAEDVVVLENIFLKSGKGIDFNCDLNFSYADVVALSQCLAGNHFKVPCSHVEDPL